MKSTTSTIRLEAPITPELQTLFKRAAEIEGRSLNDFVVSAAKKAAQQTIEKASVVQLSLNDQERFAKALLAPPKPAGSLRKAFERHRKLIDSE